MSYRFLYTIGLVGFICGIPWYVSGQAFTDVATSVGVADGGSARGIAWGDYDGDGDLDLYLVNSGQANRLFRNSGVTLDADMALVTGLADNASGLGASWGDYDNDGDLDLYLSRNGQANRLFRNNGDGTFINVGLEAKVDDTDEGRSVVWGDYNNDGHLDLYLVNDGPNRLYRNDGNGSFTDVASVARVGDSGVSHAAAWGDYDNDGDLDLYLANGRSGLIHNGDPNRLYRNNGDGTFTDVGASARVDDDGDSRGVAWGDYDNDGDLDLYVANSDDAFLVVNAPNRLYINNGPAGFTDIAGAVGVNDPGNSRGVAWGDYDNDGYLDLYLANKNTNRLFRNDHSGGFTEVGDQFDVDDGRSGVSAAWGDFNKDGWLDLYVGNDNQPNRLYRNNITGSRWLSVRLVGAQSNRNGIGARVVSVLGTTRQLRDVDGGSGYFSQPSLPVEFGFGTQAVVDSLIIQWPSGLRQVLNQVPTNQHLTAFEVDAPADISGPVITLNAEIHRVDEQEAYTVQATVTDHSTIQKALLLYRLSGVLDWTDSLTMTAGFNNLYSISIPSEKVTRQGLAFSIRAQDQFGNVTESTVQGLSVSFTDFQSEGFSLPASQNATAEDFRMISIPAVVGDRNPVSILGASLNPNNESTYDRAAWRLLRWNGSQYLEYPSAGQFDSGTAFWLIARDPATIEIASATAASDVQRKVTLAPGWNQVGTPYLFPVHVSAIIDSNQAGLIEPTFWFWNGSGYEQATVLKPWHGYWVRSLASANIDLVIPRLDADLISPKRLSTGTRSSMDTDGWTLQLIATAGPMRDEVNYIGVHSRGVDGWDPQDISEPPPIGEGAVSLSFLHEDWPLFPGSYAGDIRAKGQEGYTWSFVIESDQPVGLPTSVEVAGFERLPSGIHAVLIDTETSVEIDLQHQRTLTFSSDKRHVRRTFTLIAGSAPYIKSTRETLIPATISLQQNTPNPFNPSTSIAFELPQSSHVKLVVYNLLGQEVRGLVNEIRAAGRHTIRWNGDNTTGRSVASGIYFYQLQVDAFVQTRKMILLR